MLDTNAEISTDERPNALYAYTGAFIDELERAGLQHIVVCPGSRSTPLALALAQQERLRTWMHVDERSAAFFALGMAKRLRQPIGLLCTSGTAAANFLPALAEAKLTHIPLLVITADRPPELRDCGAPQAIDQNRLYGTHVKWFAEVALPEATNAALRYIRTLADRAVTLTQAIPAGPVHLNMPFREPLTPDVQSAQLPPLEERDQAAWYGRPQRRPYITVQETPLATLSDSSVAQLTERLATTERGLIIVGPLDQPELAAPLFQIAERLGYPVLADPLSQLRSNGSEQALLLASYDAFLRTPAFAQRVPQRPELVLRFGAMPVSKPILQYLQRHPDCQQIVIDGEAGWNEPTQLAAEMIHADPVALCQQLLPLLEQRPHRSWLKAWQEIEKTSRSVLWKCIQEFPAPFEGRVFTELAALLPADTTLYVGNSMPIRDLDTFFWHSPQRLHILGNRGANGIDGVVSSALGASAMNNGPTVLVLGDLSFYHDLNGLLAAHLHHLDLTIILINNDGGGIFSFLPQAAYPEHFEQYFGTPLGLDFRLAVEMYRGHFQRVHTWTEYREALQTSLTQSGLRVIELSTERASNVEMHRELWQRLQMALV